MRDKIRTALATDDEQVLMICLNLSNMDKFETDSFESIEKALKATWHSQHKDLVNAIYFGKLRDARFVEPILNIALDRERFTWYDDELEATLRKCVHALKTIDSNAAKIALEELRASGNENVNFTLEMYEQNGTESALLKRGYFGGKF